MRLLLITQKVDRDDWVLGFVHTWLERLAARVDRLDVLAGRTGRVALPSNVRVFALRQSAGVSRARLLLRWHALMRRLMAEGQDAVLAHMCPHYAILAAPYARLAGVPLGLWYTHRSVDWRLWLAHALVDVVLTASQESFRLPSRKVRILGHGIDTTAFSPGPVPEGPPVVLSAGRISPTKGHDVVLDAAARLAAYPQVPPFEVHVAGEVHVAADAAYRARLEARAAQPDLAGRVRWLGAVPHARMPVVYHSARVFVNCSDTGSLDKAVLEAMACGTPVLTSNEAFVKLLREDRLGPLPPVLGGSLTFPRRDTEALADKLAALLTLGAAQRAALGARLRRIVVEEHDLDVLAQRIVEALAPAGVGEAARRPM
jgi:glycosyltransferase involved in cell wall biosynthesis